MAVGNLMELTPHVIDPSLNGKIFWFYGEPSTRKTSVATKFPGELLLATENGYKFINGVIAQRISSWGEVKQVFRQLKNPEVQERFKTIVFDRADTLYDYCKQYICSIKGISDLGELAYSAGYTAAKKEFNSIIKGIESLGYGMVFITHDIVDMEKQTKQDLENNAAKVLRGYADFTFLLKKETRDEVDTVIAYSQRNESDTKTRARYFTSSFEFTYENLEKELRNAIEKQIQMEGIEVQIRERQVEQTRTFEEVKESVIKLYTHFVQIEHAEVDNINDIIAGQMQGVRISQAPESYYDKLLVIETYLLGIE
jgi:hypothetical protein